MTLPKSIVEGTLLPDGTLQLDEQPKLPPGRVEVTVQAEDWWGYLRRSRAALEAVGASLRTGREIVEQIEQVRGEAEPADGARWEAEWSKHHPEPPAC